MDGLVAKAKLSNYSGGKHKHFLGEATLVKVESVSQNQI